MQNYVYQKDISCKMFDFLCNVVGSAKIVKQRRLFFKIFEDVMHNSVFTVIASGSRAEGLNMNGSDLDIMYVINDLPIYECQSQIDNTFGLIIDAENTAPGYVLLKLPHRNIPHPLFKYTYSEYGLLLTSDEFKQTWLQEINNQMRGQMHKSTKIHGPCISSRDDICDNAFCLKSEKWPIGCMKWFYRTRYSKWPISNDVEIIATEGLLYVPIGSKFGSKNGNSLEWRISFSVPEKILVHSFNQAQLICYALLKIVLKEVITTNSRTTNLLCSYFMKTVVFWLAEESDPSSWNPKSLFTCFQSCLDRLIYWVRIGYCPNYFLPENNMFEGKIVGECQIYVLDFLTILRKDGLKLFNRSATLSTFLSNNFRYNVNDSEEEDKAIYPLLCGTLLCNPYKCSHQILRRIIGHLVNGGQFTKSLYILWLMCYYRKMIEIIPYNFHALNKYLYRSYKLLLSHSLIAKNIDVASGAVLLTAFFYRHKEYEKSLSVTNYALQECTRGKYYVHDGSSTFRGNGINNSNISFLQRHKLTCIHICMIRPSLQSVLHIQDLEVPIVTDGGLIWGPPNVLIRYLRLMCFHHLGNCVEQNRCLLGIKLTMEEECLIYNSDVHCSGFLYFIKAALVSGPNCCEKFAQDLTNSMIRILIAKK